MHQFKLDLGYESKAPTVVEHSTNSEWADGLLPHEHLTQQSNLQTSSDNQQIGQDSVEDHLL